MKIQLTGNQPISQQDISNLSLAIGATLPEDYANFNLRYNGALAHGNSIACDLGNEGVGVWHFVPIQEVLKETKIIKENITDNVISIATAEPYDHFVLNLSRNGRIFYWDNQKPAELRFVAESFDQFLGMLVPETDIERKKIKEAAKAAKVLYKNQKFFDTLDPRYKL